MKFHASWFLVCTFLTTTALAGNSHSGMAMPPEVSPHAPSHVPAVAGNVTEAGEGDAFVDLGAMGGNATHAQGFVVLGAGNFEDNESASETSSSSGDDEAWVTLELGEEEGGGEGEGEGQFRGLSPMVAAAATGGHEADESNLTVLASPLGTVLAPSLDQTVLVREEEALRTPVQGAEAPLSVAVEGGETLAIQARTELTETVLSASVVEERDSVDQKEEADTDQHEESRLPHAHPALDPAPHVAERTLPLGARMADIIMLLSNEATQTDGRVALRTLLFQNIRNASVIKFIMTELFKAAKKIARGREGDRERIALRNFLMADILFSLRQITLNALPQDAREALKAGLKKVGKELSLSIIVSGDTGKLVIRIPRGAQSF